MKRSQVERHSIFKISSAPTGKWGVCKLCSRKLLMMDSSNYPICSSCWNECSGQLERQMKLIPDSEVAATIDWNTDRNF